MIYPKEFPVLETSRLILWQSNKNDIDGIFEIFSCERVAEFDDFEVIKSKDKALKIINNFSNQFEKKVQIRWMLVGKETDELIGTFGIHDFDKDSNNCIIGYDLKLKKWNNGFITEAIERSYHNSTMRHSEERNDK